jgi:hypothetical protein
MSKSKKIVIDFCGSIEINPKDVKFMDFDTEEIISGSKYVEMYTKSPKSIQNYIVENMEEAIKNSMEYNFEKIDVFIK